MVILFWGCQPLDLGDLASFTAAVDGVPVAPPIAAIHHAVAPRLFVALALTKLLGSP